MANAKYNVVMSGQLNEDVDELAKELETTRSDVIRRAILLFKHAAKASKVTLTTESGEQQNVLLK